MKIKLAFTALSILMLFSFGASVNAQSGRKPVYAPTPVKTPEPQVNEPVKKEEPPFVTKAAYTIEVSGETPISVNSTFTSSKQMYQWISERLRDSSLVEIYFGGESNSKKAVEKAKLNPETYVLFVELNEDPFRQPQMGNPRIEQNAIKINFSFFAPQTGKARIRGTAYLEPSLLRNRNAIQRRYSCYPNLRDNDYLLMEASYEVAERILANLALPSPKRKSCR